MELIASEPAILKDLFPLFGSEVGNYALILGGRMLLEARNQPRTTLVKSGKSSISAAILFIVAEGVGRTPAFGFANLTLKPEAVDKGCQPNAVFVGTSASPLLAGRGRVGEPSLHLWLPIDVPRGT